VEKRTTMILGVGKHGRVMEGRLLDGTKVAVKCLRASDPSAVNEINVVSVGYVWTTKAVQ
jgi:RIO-like serine/threonine protein kinase